MTLELKELALGVLLAVVMLGVFRFARMHRQRGSYAVLLMSVVFPYVMFAVETHEPDLIGHSLVATFFCLLAIFGARWNLWIVVFGFLAHALFGGTLHYTSLLAPTPGWYGPLCVGFNVAVALGLAGFLSQDHKLRDMT